MLSLGTIQAATNTAAITAFVQERLAGRDGWSIVSVRRRAVRLEPPEAYWASYRVRLARSDGRPLDGDRYGCATTVAGELPQTQVLEERELRLVVRAVFDEEIWADYSARLREQFGQAPCDPLGGLGNPVLKESTQHAIWFYPVDPGLPGLITCSDPRPMRELFRHSRRHLLAGDERIGAVEVEVARYLPEIAAILRYRIERQGSEEPVLLYGKVQHSDRGGEVDRIGRDLYRLSQRYPDELWVPRPMGYHPEIQLVLQSCLPGDPVGPDRRDPVFLPAAEAAARAAATVHDSDLETEAEITVEAELARLDIVLEQFAYTSPRAHIMLRELLGHIRSRLRSLPEEEWVPSHGDLKYDQLIHHRGRFGVIDWDFFAMTETSFDLAKYCAHLVPSLPDSWEDSFAAEEARTHFLTTYRELRPEATLQRFPVYEAIDLAFRAMVLMWGQLSGWEGSAESMLALAGERLRTPLG